MSAATKKIQNRGVFSICPGVSPRPASTASPGSALGGRTKKRPATALSSISTPVNMYVRCQPKAGEDISLAASVPITSELAPKPMSSTPEAKPRLSGNLGTTAEITPLYTKPTPMPAMANAP